MFIRFFVLYTVLFSFTTLFAHQTGLSYVNITEDESNNIDIIYKKPLGDTKSDDIYLHFPTECVKVSEKKQIVIQNFIVNEYRLWCGDKGLLNSRIWVDGLVASDRGILIRYEKGEIVDKSLLRATTPFIHIDYKSSDFELFIEYTSLGIVHILEGFDHLLFVFALLLLAITKRALLFAITAFTLSHSITLAFGILGIVTVDILYVEAMIALSIVFLARELLTDNKESLTRKHLGFVTFIFGLLHGFGFSSVLASIGLPQDEIPLSLFAFNLGIELGQILFISVVGAILLLVKRYIVEYEKTLYKYIAYFIGGVSSYWLIERVGGF